MPELNVSDMARRGMSAHRSNYTPLVFDEAMLALGSQEAEVQDEGADDELRALSEIGSLKDHPGYQKMREARLGTIAHYRSGDFAESLLVDGSISDDIFGRLMRVGLLVAKELEKELKTVEAASEAVSEEKAKRNARQPRQKRA